VQELILLHLYDILSRIRLFGIIYIPKEGAELFGYQANQSFIIYHVIKGSMRYTT
jgi:hypothetical protein